jgi:hypothetical protein
MLLNTNIHGDKSTCFEFDVMMYATCTPLNQSLNTIMVYKGNWFKEENENMLNVELVDTILGNIKT